MKKSVLVCGLGRFGRSVVQGLYERGHDVFVIDRNEDALDHVRDMVVSGAILDVANDDEELLRLVGEKNFDEAVVAMGEDFEGTIMAVQVLKEAGVKVSAKALNARRGNVLLRMGADRVVFPERDMGLRLAQIIATDVSIDILELPKGFVVEQSEVGLGFAGRTIEELDLSNKFGIWILLVYTNDDVIQPKAGTRLNKGDIIVVFGQKNVMCSFEKANFG